MTVFVLKGDAQFNERRNTSRVFPVPPDALPNAMRALERSQNEEWYQWIVNRQNGVHDHASVRSDGKSRSACPMYGCKEALQP